MTELHALLARVEKATGPDREIERSIADLVELPATPGYRQFESGWFFNVRHGFDDEPDWRVPDYCLINSYPRYTASIDAAVSLVEKMLPSWSWQTRVSTSSDGEVRYTNARVWQAHDPRDDESPIYWATSSDKTPAIALIAALLKSLIAKASSHGGEG